MAVEIQKGMRVLILTIKMGEKFVSLVSSQIQISKLLTHLSIPCLALVYSCNEGENFKGGNDSAAPAQRTYATTCDMTQQISTGNNLISSFAVPPVKISGQFCQTQITTVKRKVIQVVLVNDISGSMNDNDPVDSAGSCGRFEAISKILQKLKPVSANPNAILPDYQVALINFDSTATAVSMGSGTFVGINDFLNIMPSKKTNICEAKTGTNYQGSFELAKTMLSNSTVAVDSRMVFFISDGAPSDVNSGIKKSPEEAGKEAADALKALPSLDLYVAYLNKNPGEILSYLNTLVAGQKLANSSYLALATNADTLASAIEAIIPKEPINLENQTSQLATLSAPGFAPIVNIQTSVRETVKGSGIWMFETAEFPLLGNKGQTTINTFSIAVPASNGQVARASYTIQFEYK